jgi:hypothetical protein
MNGFYYSFPNKSNDALGKAYKAAVDRDKSLAQFSQLRADVAKEKAIKEAQERAVAATVEEAKAKVEEHRRKEAEKAYKHRLLVEEEKVTRKVREEAEAERRKSEPE